MRERRPSDGSTPPLFDHPGFQEYVRDELRRASRELRAKHPREATPGHRDAMKALDLTGSINTRAGLERGWNFLCELRKRHKLPVSTGSIPPDLRKRLQQMAELP